MPQLNYPFDPVTGDLLPYYRELYLHGRLAPALAQQVETYLKGSTIQTSIMLGRYRELAEEAQRQRRTFTAPLWVQQQLLFQPSTTPTGPFRRPVVRVVSGLLLVLCVASIVQWIRNEPLVPAPVAAAVVRATTSVSQASQQFARKSMATLHLSELEQPTAAPAPKPTGAAVAQARPVRRPAPLRLTAPRAVALALPDSAAPLAAAVPVAGTLVPVQGHIYNEEGEPLAGATVLVVGTSTATSTNAEGRYALEAPAGAVLQFGYVGCAEKVLPCQLGTTLNVTLQELDRPHRQAL